MEGDRRVEVDEAVEELRLFGTARLSHGLCDGRADGLRAEFEPDDSDGAPRR